MPILIYPLLAVVFQRFLLTSISVNEKVAFDIGVDANAQEKFATQLQGGMALVFHEEREVRVIAGPHLSRGCRCSADYYRSVLARFPAEEREHMRGDDGQIAVDCAFCSRIFQIEL